MQYSIPKS